MARGRHLYILGHMSYLPVVAPLYKVDTSYIYVFYKIYRIASFARDVGF